MSATGKVTNHSGKSQSCSSTVTMYPGGKINIRPLKEQVLSNFPVNSALREVVLSEPDEMTAEEFSIKLDNWLTLLRLEA